MGAEEYTDRGLEGLAGWRCALGSTDALMK
jgi:hypothetical protein